MNSGAVVTGVERGHLLPATIPLTRFESDTVPDSRSSAESRTPGEALLHYRIIEKIGEGGMGVVYKALDTRLDRAVALKTLPSASDPKRRQQFVWEARAAAKLRHPNILVVHDIACDDEQAFIVMEYVPGSPLSDMLERGPLSISQVLRYACQIASALETAHAAGIVHRDLKPSNVLITPEDTVKIVDFGLARLQEEEIDVHNAAHVLAGTCGYMSPEQANHKRGTAQSDIFSFGAVLYEMVTGRRAFDGKSAVAVLAAVMREEPRRAGLLVSGLPATLETIIERCLRKDPRRRFQHMGDVRLALEEVDIASSDRRESMSPLWRRSVAFCTAAAMPLLAGWFMLHRTPEPRPISTPIPLTGLTGDQGRGSWSPDGRAVALTWEGEKQNNVDIYVVQPGSTQTLRLTTDPGIDSAPAWSPDGRDIAYVHVSADKTYSSLNIVSSLGGSPRSLFSTAAVIGDPAWTPDGRTLLVEVRASKRPSVITAISSETGASRQLTWPPANIPGDLSPAVSPNGRTLAFTRKTAWRTAELYLVSLSPDFTPIGNPRRVTELGYVSSPAWTPDGQSILFEATRDGCGMWQVDREGAHLRPVLGIPDSATEPALARRPDGHVSLIFTNVFGRSSIERYNEETGGVMELAPTPRSQSYPRFSYDGKRLAFSSWRSGFQEVWTANPDGSQPLQLTSLRHQLTEVGDWSPSDDAIAFVSQDRGSRQIYMVNSSGGPVMALTNEEGVNRGSGWTRDGGAYYYTTSRSGRYEIWKVSRSGDHRERVVVDGMHGFESARGRFYYWRPDDTHDATLMRRTMQGDVEVPLSPRGAPLVVTARPEGIYYKAAASGDIYRWDESTGRSTRVLEHPARGRYASFTVAADGSVVWDRHTRNTAELMIVERFR